MCVSSFILLFSPGNRNRFIKHKHRVFPCKANHVNFCSHLFLYRVSIYFDVWMCSSPCDSIKDSVSQRQLHLESNIKTPFLLPSKRTSQVNPLAAQLSVLLYFFFLFSFLYKRWVFAEAILVKTWTTFEKIVIDYQCTEKGKSWIRVMIILNY